MDALTIALIKKIVQSSGGLSQEYIENIVSEYLKNGNIDSLGTNCKNIIDAINEINEKNTLPTIDESGVLTF